MKIKTIIVNDKMQKNYVYERVEPVCKHFDPLFRPDLTPKEMLALGVFGGKYMNDCRDEFPKNWFEERRATKTSGASKRRMQTIQIAKLSPHKKDKNLNYFKVDASQSLSVWKEKGWIYKDDPRGWFQWYCRYYMGRRIEDEDKRQIIRWRMMTRHVAQIRNKCRRGDVSCNTRQRQALLHWAYDSRKI